MGGGISKKPSTYKFRIVPDDELKPPLQSQPQELMSPRNMSSSNFTPPISSSNLPKSSAALSISGRSISQTPPNLPTLSTTSLHSSNPLSPRGPIITDHNTTILEIKKSNTQKSVSRPEILNERTVFCPYIDVAITSKDPNGQTAKTKEYVQRSVAKKKASLVGEGKFNYKHFEYYEFSNKYPWLLKNLHLIKPQLQDFDMRRPIGKHCYNALLLCSG